jgi:hypothetical protein
MMEMRKTDIAAIEAARRRSLSIGLRCRNRL